MSKLIEFEPYYDGDLCIKMLHTQGKIFVGDIDGGGLVTSDPSKLDALADAIKRAADALRKSPELTFDDLAIDDYFRNEDNFVGRKSGEDTFVMIEPSPGNVRRINRVQCGQTSHTRRDSTVIRLRATFEEEKS